ncbi:D-galactonate dehydratase family protein [Clostridium sediminicola]|uniref:enolase C-terminal domain-like protein n=1 Tax=Clostridium sediminicola TaxID=3114879 RepID=UPI0031F23BAF
MSNLTIKNIKVIACNPNGKNLLTVKIETSDPQIYGLGCATLHQRYLAVKVAIEEYLTPFLIGKDPRNIEDIWHSAHISGYWRNGPILNNALSGIDMALWDIKGKLADMPLYQLLGGKSRSAIAAYVHAKGNSLQEVENNIRGFMRQGYKYIRCQIGEYGGNFNSLYTPKNLPEGVYFDPEQYMESTIELLEYLSKTIQEKVYFLHDVHERLDPVKAVQFTKRLEKFNLFYLEDILPPENQEWLKMLRNQTATPIAMGELYSNTSEWKSVISQRLIDFIRIHISDIGGITPAKKIAAFSEIFGVKTAWHGAPDLTPIGMAANIHLDISSPNAGIQEYCAINDAMREVFIGAPEPVEGYFYPIDKPGLGVDIDEEKALLYPCINELPKWTNPRLPDGTSVKP